MRRIRFGPNATHGLPGTYANGCRCGPCQDAHAARIAAYRRGERQGVRHYMTSNAKALALRPAEVAIARGRCRKRCEAGHLWTPRSVSEPCPTCAGWTSSSRGKSVRA